jgi:hypothetical protein
VRVLSLTNTTDRTAVAGRYCGRCDHRVPIPGEEDPAPLTCHCACHWRSDAELEVDRIVSGRERTIAAALTVETEERWRARLLTCQTRAARRTAVHEWLEQRGHLIWNADLPYGG